MRQVGVGDWNSHLDGVGRDQSSCSRPSLASEKHQGRNLYSNQGIQEMAMTLTKEELHMFYSLVAIL